MAEINGQCMTCRHDDGADAEQTMSNPTIKVDDGTYSAEGECPNCGGSMFKFMSEDDAKEFADEEGLEVQEASDEE